MVTFHSGNFERRASCLCHEPWGPSLLLDIWSSLLCNCFITFSFPGLQMETLTLDLTIEEWAWHALQASVPAYLAFNWRVSQVTNILFGFTLSDFFILLSLLLDRRSRGCSLHHAVSHRTGICSRVHAADPWILLDWLLAILPCPTLHNVHEAIYLESTQTWAWHSSLLRTESVCHSSRIIKGSALTFLRHHDIRLLACCLFEFFIKMILQALHHVRLI